MLKNRMQIQRIKVYKGSHVYMEAGVIVSLRNSNAPSQHKCFPRMCLSLEWTLRMSTSICDVNNPIILDYILSVIHS